MNTDLFRGYRTIVVNVITLVVLCLTGLTGQITDPETLRYIAIGLTVLNVVLRYLTNTPVGKDKPL